jgi:hypothetical protein
MPTEVRGEDVSWINEVGSSITDAWLWFNTARVACTAAAVGAGAAVIGARAAVRSFGQTRRDSKARSRPMMAAELKLVPHASGSQALITKNYGLSIAKDVTVTFDPPIAMPENPDDLVTPFLLRRYAKPIPVMTPGMELDNLYFSSRLGPDGHFYNGEPVPDLVTVKIAYKSADGDCYSDEFPLDVRLLLERTYATSSTSPEGQAKKALEHFQNIAASLKSLADSGALLTKEERARRQVDAVEQAERLKAEWNNWQEQPQPPTT